MTHAPKTVKRSPLLLMLFLTLRGVYRVHGWTTRMSEATAEAVTNRAAAPAQSLMSQEPVSAPP